MNITMKKIGFVSILLGMLGMPGVLLAATTFNNDAQDKATLRVVNMTTDSTCTTCWTTSLSANPGNILSFAVYYHNAGSETAKNVRVRLTPQLSPSGTTHSFTATVLADNASAVTGTATVAVPNAQTVSFLSGSVFWRANQAVHGSTALLNGQNGQEIFSSTGLLLGDIAPGWGTQGSVVVRFQVSDVNANTSSSYAPLVTTRPATSVSQNFAVLNGYVDPRGSYDTTRWFEWGTSSSFGNATTHLDQGAGATDVYTSLSSLAQNTTYYYRAVAQNSKGVVYGTTLSFVTTVGGGGNTSSLPVVSTRPATGISQNFAVLNGYVDPSGSGDTTRWFEWGTSSYSLNNGTAHTSQGINPSDFYASLSSLAQNTTYYYRAVAQNAQGTVYGSVVSFTTNYSGNGNQGGTLNVITRNATGVSYDFAVLNGYLEVNGSSDNTTRWFEWGTSTYLNNTTSHISQNGTSDFYASISGLNQNTTYYFRAVAQNSQGTVYGGIMSLSTNYTGNTGNGNQSTFVPLVSTRNVDVSGDFAILNGYVDPNGSNDTTRWFEWGGSQALGSITPRLAQGNVASMFSATLSSLVPNTTYYYRAMARNSQGTVYGSVLSFTTNSYGGGSNTSGQLAPTAVTTLATETSGTQARLNSLVFSTGNQPSTAWFEWGTNTTLGNRTQMVNVGSLPSVRHSEYITGLSLGTTYYYRVVAENPYGKSYGSTFNFVMTEAAPQTPVVTTPVPRPTVPQVRPATVAVNRGVGTQSPVGLTVDGGDESIAPSEERTYHIAWKNNSTQAMKRVVLRVEFPTSMQVVSSDTGVFSREGNMVTFDVKTLGVGEAGEATIRANVKRGTETGTLLVVTANMVYTDTRNVQGDAVAYITHRVEQRDNALGASTFNAGAFLPTTLLEWVIFAGLMLGLVLVGNTLYGRLAGAKH